MKREEYHAAITDAWKFMRRWLEDERLRIDAGDVTAWTDAVSEAQAISDRYGSRFVTDMLSLILGEDENVRLEEYKRDAQTKAVVPHGHSLHVANGAVVGGHH